MSNHWKVLTTQQYGIVMVYDAAETTLDENGLPKEHIADDVQGEANAHLIAAAPKLYAALKPLYEHFQNDMTICGLLTEAKEALAEAEGGEG